MTIEDEEQPGVREEFTARIRALAAEDPEAFLKIGMELILSMEDYLREVCNPDDPAIQVLDDYYREHPELPPRLTSRS